MQNEAYNITLQQLSVEQRGQVEKLLKQRYVNCALLLGHSSWDELLQVVSSNLKVNFTAVNSSTDIVSVSSNLGLLPFANCQFPLIFLASSLNSEALGEEGTLQELYRVLAPEGRLLLVAMRPSWWQFANKLFNFKTSKVNNLALVAPTKVANFFMALGAEIELLDTSYKNRVYLLMVRKKLMALTPLKVDWDVKLGLAVNPNV